MLSKLVWDFILLPLSPNSIFSCDSTFKRTRNSWLGAHARQLTCRQTTKSSARQLIYPTYDLKNNASLVTKISVKTVFEAASHNFWLRWPRVNSPKNNKMSTLAYSGINFAGLLSSTAVEFQHQSLYCEREISAHAPSRRLNKGLRKGIYSNVNVPLDVLIQHHYLMTFRSGGKLSYKDRCKTLLGLRATLSFFWVHFPHKSHRIYLLSSMCGLYMYCCYCIGSHFDKKSLNLVYGWTALIVTKFCLQCDSLKFQSVMLAIISQCNVANTWNHVWCHNQKQLRVNWVTWEVGEIRSLIITFF